MKVQKVPDQCSDELLVSRVTVKPIDLCICACGSGGCAVRASQPADPAWKNGDPGGQTPSLRLTSVYFKLATKGGNPALYRQALTREKAEQLLKQRLQALLKGNANITSASGRPWATAPSRPGCNASGPGADDQHRRRRAPPDRAGRIGARVAAGPPWGSVHRARLGQDSPPRHSGPGGLVEGGSGGSVAGSTLAGLRFSFGQADAKPRPGSCGGSASMRHALEFASEIQWIFFKQVTPQRARNTDLTAARPLANGPVADGHGRWVKSAQKPLVIWCCSHSKPTVPEASQAGQIVWFNEPAQPCVAPART